ncbi:MAG: hypothetical protein ACYCSF_04500 [Acidimicrobiales bacterium]
MAAADLLGGCQLHVLLGHRPGAATSMANEGRITLHAVASEEYARPQIR